MISLKVFSLPREASYRLWPILGWAWTGLAGIFMECLTCPRRSHLSWSSCQTRRHSSSSLWLWLFGLVVEVQVGPDVRGEGVLQDLGVPRWVTLPDWTQSHPLLVQVDFLVVQAHFCDVLFVLEGAVQLRLEERRIFSTLFTVL